MNDRIHIGQSIQWGDPAHPNQGVIKTMSQNGMFLFVEQIFPMPKWRGKKYITLDADKCTPIGEVHHVQE
jgi:hypothetical protein